MYKIEFMPFGDGPYLTPSRGTALSAGYDLYCSEAVILTPGVVTLVKTNTRFGDAWPANVWAKIEDRSGLAVRSGVTNLAGVIDPDYRGEIGCVQISFVGHKYGVGDRVAQLVLHNMVIGDDLVSGDRGDRGYRGSSGFGSTGR
jgi:dUTP pyrophosphatase